LLLLGLRSSIINFQATNSTTNESDRQQCAGQAAVRPVIPEESL